MPPLRRLTRPLTRRLTQRLTRRPTHRPDHRTARGSARWPALCAVAALAATASVVPFTTFASATTSAAPLPLPVRTPYGGDHLTVTVADSGDPAYDGTYELHCHPTAGAHPAAGAACDRLDELTVWGRPSPFAPVPPDARCTMRYGGPATARVTGVWAGRPVDAAFRRDNGCEITRWDRLVPLLPLVSLLPHTVS